MPSAARIFAQNEARCNEKNGNFTSEPCDKADDAKCSFRKGATNEKYAFFKWNLQISGCNKWCKKGTGIIGGPKRQIFHDFAFVPLSKSCFPPRAGSIFSKNKMRFCKKMCSKHGRHKENSRSYTKLSKLLHRCIHSFLLTGLWRLKMHKSWAIIKILKGARNEKRANRTSQGTIRASKSDKSSSYEGRLGVKKVKISIEIA